MVSTAVETQSMHPDYPDVCDTNNKEEKRSWHQNQRRI